MFQYLASSSFSLRFHSDNHVFMIASLQFFSHSLAGMCAVFSFLKILIRAEHGMKWHFSVGWNGKDDILQTQMKPHHKTIHTRETKAENLDSPFCYIWTLIWAVNPACPGLKTTHLMLPDQQPGIFLWFRTTVFSPLSVLTKGYLVDLK